MNTNISLVDNKIKNVVYLPVLKFSSLIFLVFVCYIFGGGHGGWWNKDAQRQVMALCYKAALVVYLKLRQI